MKEIIIGKTIVNEITVDFAFELLSHMKGALQLRFFWMWLWEPILLGQESCRGSKTQVFLYEADTARLEKPINPAMALPKLLLRAMPKLNFLPNYQICQKRLSWLHLLLVLEIFLRICFHPAVMHTPGLIEIHGQSMFEHNKEQQKRF
ncbi:MAG: hypothetical protein CM15mP58_18770 [Burkholderiaceae bacterium]|nr:MAG: hypothetical protein CM15mP58_18770 [Burkholderiaceae bacterium]